MFLLAIFSLVLTFFLFVSSMYLLSEVAAIPPSMGLWSYIWSWLLDEHNPVYWQLFLIWILLIIGLGTIFALGVLLNLANATTSVATKFAFSLASFTLPIGMVVTCFMVLFFLFPDPLVVSSPRTVDGYPNLVLFGALLLASAPSIAVGLIVFVLTLSKTVLEFLKAIIMGIFDAASSPTTSLFTYASSLIGMAVLAIKIIKEM